MEIVGTETCLHIESAKEFLRVCAEQGLGIRFSW
jgi:hypothetical protein